MSNSPATPPTYRRKFPWLPLAIGAGCLGLFAVIAFGPQPTSRQRTSQVRIEEDRLANARELLRKEVTRASCDQAIQQLNAYLVQPKAGDVPSAMSDELKRFLSNELRLDAAQLAEAERPEFTPLDAHHLDECILLRDAVAGLQIMGPEVTALEKARTAFSWVCRQIWLNERPGGTIAPPLFALKRGYGTVTERGITFLTLLLQLDLVGAQVGNRGDRPGESRTWAVAALVEGEFHLFDPRSGNPVVDAGGNPLTLSMLRTDPAKAAEWLKQANVTVEQAKSADVFPAGTCGALPPRMKYLQDKLGSANPVRLHLDILAADRAVHEAVRRPGMAGCRVVYSNLPTESPWRVLINFLPSTDGGNDRSPQGKRNLDQWESDLVPRSGFPAKLESQRDPRFKQIYATRFRDLVEGVSAPRNQILRGQYDAARVRLIALRDEVNNNLKSRLALEPDLDSEVEKWLKELNDLTAAIAKAAAAKENIAPLVSRYESLWTRENNKVGLLIARSAIPVWDAEATYMIALAKHEQAEQTVARVLRLGQEATAEERQDAIGLARSASGWWSAYLNQYGSNPLAPKLRADHAKALQARAESLASLLK